MHPVAPAHDGPTTKRRAGRHETVAAAVAPVVGALSEDARQRIATVSAAAERDAAAELDRARNEAAAILEKAGADGERAAAQRAAAEVAAAHRDAHRSVLAARREAYLGVRRRALEVLTRRGETEEGQRLGAVLEQLACARVGPSPTVRRSGPGSLIVAASSGRRRAVIGPDELVDRALRALDNEVATLWT
jgi:vacuolar-type H+-ATPase subunit E/Vma4